MYDSYIQSILSTYLSNIFSQLQKSNFCLNFHLSFKDYIYRKVLGAWIHTHTYISKVNCLISNSPGEYLYTEEKLYYLIKLNKIFIGKSESLNENLSSGVIAPFQIKQKNVI